MLIHVPIAIGVQCICWLIGHILGAPTRASVWMGCFAGSAVCVMREITQREYQWIEAFGGGLRANMPGYMGMKFWEWNAHSITETLVAIGATIALAAFCAWWRPQ
ncbi:hypothetical protein C1T17_18800 [Sphingobium sp. SCG-1]|nr:hypothetical protein C1T17_18800 [Sphingobium sp. SCG-1]